MRLRVLVLLAPIIIVGAALFVSVADVGSPRLTVFARAMAVLGIALGYMLNRMTHTIVLHGSEASVEFQSLLRRRVVPVTEINAIVPTSLGDLVVRHTQGSERVPASFPGVGEVLAWIRRGNPDVSFGGVLDR